MQTRPLLLVATAALFFGCASSPKEGDATVETNLSAESYRVITAPHTPLYRYGPAQAGGPDMLLKKDDLVTVVKKEWGFSRVRTEDQMEGYVANDRLAEAPEDRVSMALMPPSFRTDTSTEPEWLQMVPVDQMINEPLPPFELDASEEAAASAVPVLTDTSAAPDSQPTATPETNGQNDHQ